METLQILRKHIDNAENFLDMEIFIQILNNVEKQLADNEGSERLVRCIDLEGFDACGKSTVANGLVQQLNERGQTSRLLNSPPEKLRRFRSYFDEQDELVRRAYYFLGNLITSFDLKTQSDSIITILDRYWPSTIAYQIAGKHNPETIDEIQLSWPKCLAEPILIAYITVDEDERCRRLNKRSATIAVTDEEKQLAEQTEFRRQLDFIYRHKIPSSHLRIIDGTPATETVVNNILDLYEQSIEN